MSSRSPVAVITDTGDGPGCLIRIVWFILIGWWVSFIVLNVAIVFMLTIIGIPIGVWLINRIPQVATLKFDHALVATSYDDGYSTVTVATVEQRPFLLRAIWFFLVGWWLTILALYLAWLLCITIIGIPLAFPIFESTGTLLTLKRG